MRRWVFFSIAALALSAAPLAGPLATPAAAAIPDPIAPFSRCPNHGFQVHFPPGGPSSTLGVFELSTSTFQPIKDLGIGVNAIGYSETQRVFWGMKTSTGPGLNTIVRIDSLGNITDIGRPLDAANAPIIVTTVTGTVDGNHLLIHNKGIESTPDAKNELLDIDVDPDSPTIGHVLATVPLSRATPGFTFLEIGDWDINPADHQLYSLEMQGGPPSTTRLLIKINQATGAVTTVADVTDLLPDGQNYGAVYVERPGTTIYISNNDVNREHNRSQTFGLQQADPPVVTAYAPGPPLNVNDGADCLLATDFGDAPASYHTLSNDGGPGHIIINNPNGRKLFIGQVIDSDLDGYLGSVALGDDESLPTNDEDGVPHGTVLNGTAPKLTVPVTNTTRIPATLAGWIDRNLNGTFDANERAMATIPPGGTSAQLNWSTGGLALGGRQQFGGLVLAAAAPSVKTFMRLRLFPGTVDDPQPTGSDFVPGGEVEDHQIALTSLPITGSNLTPLMIMGLGLLLCGAVAIIYARRKA